MSSEISSFCPGRSGAGTPTRPAQDIFILAEFKAQLQATGRIYPRPWCWKRFCIMFNLAVEPPWLSTWWTMSRQEKKDLFLQQLEYLAAQPMRFQSACRFLHRLGDENWVFE